jgi:hypothetical protein
MLKDLLSRRLPTDESTTSCYAAMLTSSRASSDEMSERASHPTEPCPRSARLIQLQPEAADFGSQIYDSLPDIWSADSGRIAFDPGNHSGLFRQQNSRPFFGAPAVYYPVYTISLYTGTQLTLRLTWSESLFRFPEYCLSIRPRAEIVYLNQPAEQQLQLASPSMLNVQSGQVCFPKRRKSALGLDDVWQALSLDDV